MSDSDGSIGEDSDFSNDPEFEETDPDFVNPWAKDEPGGKPQSAAKPLDRELHDIEEGSEIDSARSASSAEEGSTGGSAGEGSPAEVGGSTGEGSPAEVGSSTGEGSHAEVGSSTGEGSSAEVGGSTGDGEFVGAVASSEVASESDFSAQTAARIRVVRPKVFRWLDNVEDASADGGEAVEAEGSVASAASEDAESLVAVGETAEGLEDINFSDAVIVSLEQMEWYESVDGMVSQSELIAEFGPEAAASIARGAPLALLPEEAEAAGFIVLEEGAVTAGSLIDFSAAAAVGEVAGGAAAAAGDVGAAVLGAEAVGEAAAALGATTALGSVLGATAVGSVVVAAVASIVLVGLCLGHMFPMCKKKVCTDPNGNWHSHASHCTGGCWDPNGYWHRREKHCEGFKCQDLSGNWRHHRHHCDEHSCKDPNNKVHKNLKHCEGYVCRDSHRKAHRHPKHCKRDLIAERNAAFANADLINFDNSYIVITNAANFQHSDLEVLKHMVILPADHEEESNQAFFESDIDENFYAEGELTQMNYSPGIFTGNFTFAHPNNDAGVEGKWVSVDPASNDEKAKQILAEIKQAQDKAVSSQ